MSTGAETAFAALLQDPEIGKLLDALDGDGVETRIVGGAVRNVLMALPVSEIDFATTALPDEATRRAEGAGFKAIPTGIEHGTVTLVVDGRAFEVTTLREDIETDGRHAVVRFGRSFKIDASRRDFTINALSLDRQGRIHDYTGGVADIEARRVRFIGDPRRRIEEDYLRILRFFRFHASYAKGALDADGFAAAIELRAGLRHLSAERLRAELLKFIASPGAAATASQMLGGGFWPLLLNGVPHIGRFASFVESVVADSGGRQLLSRLAALAVLTREDAARLRLTLRLSNAESKMLTDIAVALERLHGWMYRQSEPAFEAAFARAVLDLGAAAVSAALRIEAEGWGVARVAALQRQAVELPAFPLSGADVLARGVPPGPEIGCILALARTAWIEARCPLDKPRLASILDHAAAARR